LAARVGKASIDKRKFLVISILQDGLQVLVASPERAGRGPSAFSFFATMARLETLPKEGRGKLTIFALWKSC